jgi:Concanavalin A-like lectin/glucanases superfamily
MGTMMASSFPHREGELDLLRAMTLLGSRQYWQKLLASGPIAYWPLWEPSGSVANDVTRRTAAAAELMINPGFETLGAGGADVFANWGEMANAGVISQTTAAGEFRGGAAACKLTQDALVYQDFAVQAGNSYRLSFWTRGDGVRNGKYRVRDVTNSVDIRAYTDSGVTGTDFAQVTYDFVAPAGCATARVYFIASGYATYSIFDDVTVKTTLTNQNGSYVGVTLGQPGIGDRHCSPLFDGVSVHKVSVFSSLLAQAFSGSEGSLALWCKVSGAGVWTDGIRRRAVILWADDYNHVYIGKMEAANDNYFRCGYAAGNVHKSVNVVLSTANWFHACVTWSKSADENKFYIDGAQQTDLLTGMDVHTGLGNFAGMLANASMIGAGGDGVYVWDGYLAHAAVWNRALTAGEIAKIATL